MANRNNVVENDSNQGVGVTDSQIGTVVGGKYRLLERIGLGGMGTVYRAEHIEIGRIVAVKILRSHLLENEEYLARFNLEARIANKLTHPNTVTAFDFGITGDTPYLVMPFVEGRVLKSILLERGAMPLSQVASILQQVGSALSDAHELGIVHRDLKPDNIMIHSRPGKPDWAWVLDFGIAKPLDAMGVDHDPKSSITRSGAFVGTPQYMAPEQALCKEVDLRTDVYALGIILYEMLTGDLPFKSASSPVEILMKQVNGIPIPVRTFKPELDIPEGVSSAIAKALAKEKADRHQSVQELVDEFISGCGNSANATIVVPPKIESRKIEVRKYIWPALALVLVAIAGLASTRFLSDGSTPEQEKVAAVAARAVESSAVQPEKPAEPVTPLLAAESKEPVAEVKPPIAEIKQEVPPPAPVEPPKDPLKAEENTAEDGLAELDRRAAELAGLEQELADATAPAVEAEPAPQVPEAALKLLEPGTVALEAVPPAEVAPVEPAVVPAIKKDSPAANKEALRLYQEARALMSQKSYDQAVPLLLQAVELRESYLPARLSLGESYLRLGQMDQAKEQFEMALAMDPKYAPTHYNFAAMYARSGENEKSFESLKTAIRLYGKAKTWTTTDTDFDSVRELPEFQAIIR